MQCLRVPESHSTSKMSSTSLQSSSTFLYPTTSSPCLCFWNFFTSRRLMDMSWFSTYVRILSSLAEPGRSGCARGRGRPDDGRAEVLLGAGDGRDCCGRKPPELDMSAIFEVMR